MLEGEGDTKTFVNDEDVCVYESEVNVIWKVPEPRYQREPEGHPSSRPTQGALLTSGVRQNECDSSTWGLRSKPDTGNCR